jgi:hypothetical protein
MSQLQRLIITFKPDATLEFAVTYAHGDLDELEPSYVESVRRYNARRADEMRAAWCEYHQGQAARHRAVLETLIARHEGEAAKLMDVQPEGEAELGAQKPHEQRWPEAQGRGMGS